VVTAWPPIVTADVHGTRVVAGGYGLGLNVAIDSRLGTMVEHSGGLPGFGSNMRWLPERGVAAIALANLRYAPARRLTQAALDVLHDAGELPPEASRSTPELEQAAQDLVDLLNRWDPEAAGRLFSFNVDLDEPLERRHRRADERLAAHGPLQVRSVTAVTRAEGDVEVVDQRGEPLTLSFMLSSEARTRVQWYELVGPEPAGR
jgi:CubicO group peptidase (beta-lactamase class C family)